mmetsp:Transcript_5512/g.7419  ORF Transcript_5512/g.7419 Transcript_5512/m.7419 type:complete len:446 (-) Transcript_5512:110-1447(-)
MRIFLNKPSKDGASSSNNNINNVNNTSEHGSNSNINASVTSDNCNRLLQASTSSGKGQDGSVGHGVDHSSSSKTGNNINTKKKRSYKNSIMVNEFNKKKKSIPLISSSSSSGDRKRSATANANNIRDVSFITALKRRGLQMVPVDGDGNCLFRAISIQIYGDANMHTEVRRRCMDFMAKDSAHFSQFIEGTTSDITFLDYVSRKRSDGVHGNNPEIQAISELYNRPIEVYVPSTDRLRANNPVNSKGESCDNNDDLIQPINIFHSDYKTNDTPIRLSYHDGNHYNAIIDPYLPTAGLGLGLPDLKLGLADKMQMKKAFIESDQLDLDFSYQKNALAMSDIEATDYALEQAVLVSSLEESTKKEERKPSPINDGNSFEDEVLTQHPDSSKVVSIYSSSATAEPQDEYPEFVQELVMNGFELSKVLRARDLIGDNFDNLLMFLMNNP